jgi:hypothetical protein
MSENEMVLRVEDAIRRALDARSGVIMLGEVARAAIAAMREPTDEMRKVCSFETAEVEWPAMIDAALKSPQSDT